MGRARVDHDLVLDTGFGQRLVERVVLLGRDVLVGTGLEGENRRLDLGCAVDRAGVAVAGRQ